MLWQLSIVGMLSQRIVISCVWLVKCVVSSGSSGKCLDWLGRHLLVGNKSVQHRPEGSSYEI
jgi:hypothetical protein